MTYTLTRTCADCNHEMTQEISKREAVFVSLGIREKLWDTPCAACGFTRCAGVWGQTVPLDQALFDEWGRDQDLWVDGQDEHIILGEPENLPLVVRGLESDSYLDSKKQILLGALCIVLHDALVECEDETDESFQERRAVALAVRPELLKREVMLRNQELWISDYVKEVIFPNLGLPLT